MTCRGCAEVVVEVVPIIPNTNEAPCAYERFITPYKCTECVYLVDSVTVLLIRGKFCYSQHPVLLGLVTLQLQEFCYS